MFFEAVRDRDETPDKHPRVPAILPAVDVFQRALKIRLLDKLLGLEKGRLGFLRAFRRRQFVSDADVTVTRRRLGRFDADGDNGLTARYQIK